MYRWPIRPDPERGPDAIRVGPPELLRESADGEWQQSDLAARSSDAGADRQRQRPGLARRFEPSPPGLEPGHGPRQRRESPHDLGRRQPGRPLAGGRRLVGSRGPGLGPAPAPARAHLETEGCCRRSRSSSSASAPTAAGWFRARTPMRARAFTTSGAWGRGSLVFGSTRSATGPPGTRPAFTGDGRLMALGIAPDQVLLADAATGRELARLTTLQPVTPTPLVFSPDGTKLIASTNQKTVLVWDLRRIRDQLAPMGLDWDAPPYPTVPAASDAAGPLPPPRPVRVVGEVIEPQARRAAELAEMNRRLAAKPDDAEALIHRGWLFTQQKKWPEAIADLERGLHLRPDDTDALFLAGRGVQPDEQPAGGAGNPGKVPGARPDDIDARVMKGQVALRLGRLQEAVDDFSKVLDADPESRSPVRYRRAQIWLRLGKFQEALADLDILIRALSQGSRPLRAAQPGPRSPGPPRAGPGRHEAGRRISRRPALSITTTWPGGWPPARPPCAIPSRRWSWPGRRSRWRPARPSTSTRWALPSTVRASMPRRSPPWKKASPPARASPTPSTCSSWPWLATSWARLTGPGPTSTAPSAGGASIPTPPDPGGPRSSTCSRPRPRPS